VNTWNGGRSEVDREVNQERLSLKRSHSNSYDDDLDRGKVNIVYLKFHRISFYGIQDLKYLPLLMIVPIISTKWPMSET
jgi:hypothetical protein